ncbi:uncharacterized protein LOC141972514 isoform X4 [Athene noctua]|uniref:uncharacterized protein LOC141972514 isoform X4 n=1 Tax=Athene noctua TaxID=126797 RepID=UPI003EBF2650
MSCRLWPPPGPPRPLLPGARGPAGPLQPLQGLNSAEPGVRRSSCQAGPSQISCSKSIPFINPPVRSANYPRSLVATSPPRTLFWPITGPGVKDTARGTDDPVVFDAEGSVRGSVAQTSCLTPPSKRPRTVSTGAPTAPGCPPEAASHPRVWSHTPCRWPVCPHPNQIPLTRTKSSKSSGRCLTSGIDSTNSRCVFLSFEQDLDYAVATRPPGSRRQPSKPPVLITTFDGRPREGSPCSNFQSIAKLHIRLLCTLLNISKLFISFTSFRYL